jgi:hypothetical protein
MIVRRKSKHQRKEESSARNALRGQKNADRAKKFAGVTNERRARLAMLRDISGMRVERITA